MKTQTAQLSLLQTKQINGGFTSQKLSAIDAKSLSLVSLPQLPGTPAITQSMRETGGPFNVY